MIPLASEFTLFGTRYAGVYSESCGCVSRSYESKFRAISPPTFGGDGVDFRTGNDTTVRSARMAGKGFQGVVRDLMLWFEYMRFSSRHLTYQERALGL